FLALLLYFGQRLMRPWFHLVAQQKSPELFMLNVLLVTLGLAWLTALFGLSLALGAFLAGMLISETEYRYQVEADIQPFRDVLLGLFFITVGMLLDMGAVLHNALWVGVVLLGLLGGKFILIAGLARLLGRDQTVALRSGLALAQAGEFGFVMLSQAGALNLIPSQTLQVVLAAMVLSMLAAPMLIHHNERVARYLSGSEWSDRALDLHEIAVKSIMANQHVILCGYGRSGQYLARFLEQEGIAFIALDLDPHRVKAAAAAGESVVFGDAARREVLMAAGLSRARALVVSYADTPSALKVLHHVQELRPELPVIVRTLDDSDLERLKNAGATEVVPEVLEGTLMVASHALMLLGVPLSRVVKRVRQVREERYDLLRGFFHGASDEAFELGETVQPRLHSVVLAHGAAGIGKSLRELDLAALPVEVTAVRRRNIKAVAPLPETVLEEGDVLVLMGAPENLAAAEMSLLQG
ncbi:MAG: cation:proton antiporter, partial [Sulfuricellaceae bacterium]|nr:cation:proton antiporter [Sulfuricellaceae bacterium]